MRKIILWGFILTSIGTLAAAVLPVPDIFTFQFRQEGGRYIFNGNFQVDTDSRLAWDVLTDYDHVSRFVANLNSRVLSREGDQVMVDQTVGGGFLFIRQEVRGLLKIQEKPYESICLEEISRKQFGFYQGQWTLSLVSPGSGMRVAYELEAERNLATPSFVTAGLFRQAAEDLVIGMKNEMDRRETVKRMNSLKVEAKKSGS